LNEPKQEALMPTLTTTFRPQITRARALLTEARDLIHAARWRSDEAEDACQDIGCTLGQAIEDLGRASAAEDEWLRERGL
jgi:hypothetical protein